MRAMIDRVKAETGEDTIFVSDASSNIGSRDLSRENLWEDLGVVFAGS